MAILLPLPITYIMRMSRVSQETAYYEIAGMVKEHKLMYELFDTHCIIFDTNCIELFDTNCKQFVDTNCITSLEPAPLNFLSLFNV